MPDRAKLQEILVILARIESDLQHHIKRTALLEEEVRSWKDIVLPIQSHVNLIQALTKVVMGMAAIGAAVATFIALK